MKAALRTFAILALLSGVAFAQIYTEGAGLRAVGILVFVPLFLFISSTILSIVAFALGRNGKEGGIRKRLANFAVPLLIFNVTLLISFIIALAMFVPPLQPILNHMIIIGIWAPIIMALILITAPFLVTVFLSRKYAKSGWLYIAAAFVFVVLELLTPIYLVSGDYTIMWSVFLVAGCLGAIFSWRAMTKCKDSQDKTKNSVSKIAIFAMLIFVLFLGGLVLPALFIGIPADAIPQFCALYGIYQPAMPAGVMSQCLSREAQMHKDVRICGDDADCINAAVGYGVANCADISGADLFAADACFFDLATATNNSSLCDNLIISMDTSKADACILRIATTTNNPSVCKGDELCIMKVVKYNEMDTACNMTIGSGNASDFCNAVKRVYSEACLSSSPSPPCYAAQNGVCPSGYTPNIIDLQNVKDCISYQSNASSAH